LGLVEERPGYWLGYEEPLLDRRILQNDLCHVVA